MDARQIINYVNFAALICYILGRVLNMGSLSWIGLGIMTLSSIWTIIHWKENDKMSDYHSSDSNSAAMSIKGFFQNTYYKWGFLFLFMFALHILPIPIKKWICIVFLILSPVIPIWGLTKWKQNSRLLNYEWIALLVIIILAWALLLYFIGPNNIISFE